MKNDGTSLFWITASCAALVIGSLPSDDDGAEAAPARGEINHLVFFISLPFSYTSSGSQGNVKSKMSRVDVLVCECVCVCVCVWARR